ncbi:lysophospholipid acyltransferase family protein [Bacillaceae bacterium W0354]
MIRTIISLLYGIGYVIYTIPFLIRIKMFNRSEMSREEYNNKAHRIPKAFGRAFVKSTGCEVVIKGEEHIPNVPFLIVGNHQSNMDIFVYLGYVQQPFGFISKIEVRKLPLVRTWMEAMDCLFLDRDDRRQSVKTFKKGIQLLKDGHPLAIYPEGTRSLSREMLPFKSGSFSLAKKAGVPILPVMVDGTYESFEANKNRFKKTTINLTFCKPIDPEQIEHMTLEELAKESQNRIQHALNEVAYRQEVDVMKGVS